MKNHVIKLFMLACLGLTTIYPAPAIAQANASASPRDLDVIGAMVNADPALRLDQPLVPMAGICQAFRVPNLL